ncbi:MAG: MarR family winged helix-turn-helix transcriptional regulator [Janthinobacterium lividum]
MHPFDIYKSPGHLIRRANQIVVSLFIEQTADQLTPVQFGLMALLLDSAGADQVTLAQKLALDTSTAGAVLARLEAKGWVKRQVDSEDRRRRLLYLTDSGRRAYEAVRGDVETVQQRILGPLDEQEREVFMRLLTKLVVSNNENSRAPLKLGVPTEAAGTPASDTA